MLHAVRCFARSFVLRARAPFPLGATPLAAAAFFNNAEVVEALVELRADADARVRTFVSFFRPTTARDIAAMYRRQAALAVLDR